MKIADVNIIINLLLLIAVIYCIIKIFKTRKILKEIKRKQDVLNQLREQNDTKIAEVEKILSDSQKALDAISEKGKKIIEDSKKLREQNLQLIKQNEVLKDKLRTFGFTDFDSIK